MDKNDGFNNKIEDKEEKLVDLNLKVDEVHQMVEIHLKLIFEPKEDGMQNTTLSFPPLYYSHNILPKVTIEDSVTIEKDYLTKDLHKNPLTVPEQPSNGGEHKTTYKVVDSTNMLGSKSPQNYSIKGDNSSENPLQVNILHLELNGGVEVSIPLTASEQQINSK
ncbi:hypothetical protein KI387_008180, partial [Taxus chinensis]